jgi:transcriptional regulator GlxA family with amidase domain
MTYRPADRPAIRDVVHGRVVAAVNVLSDRLAESWTLDALADEGHLSQAARAVGRRNQFHASQCLHAANGISPTEYRRRQPAVP